MGLFSKTVSLLLTLLFFQVPKFSQGKVSTLNRRGKKINHLSMAYSVIDICTKNCYNRTTAVKIIVVGGWVVYFFETQCTCSEADIR